MSTVQDTVTAHLIGHETFSRAHADQPARINELRRLGLERFSSLGFPTTRDEAWRKTNIRRIAQGSFARSGHQDLDRERIEPFAMPGVFELVFVSGRRAPELERSAASLPDGVIATSLAQAIVDHPDLVLAHVGRHAPIDDHPFAALNQAWLEDGAFIYVPRGVVVETPIHVLLIGRQNGDLPIACHPRNVIVAEESSQVTVIEDYAGFTGDVYFTCPVTEIVAEENAVIDHYRLQQESTDAFHVAMQQSHQARASNIFSHSISHGAALARNDIRAMLDGEGIECTLNGLYLARGNQHIDHHMWVDHAKPNCHSYELYKGVLEDQARAVFNGTIHVHQDAQKTDAKQSNRNLLLSKDALVSSNPQLIIYADDVRCTHGSTTGHLEDEAIFYLRSRGIGEEAAKSLLTYAFAAEVLLEIRLERIRKDLEEFLFTRLPKGEVVRQAV